jgi:hypothetical protein
MAQMRLLWTSVLLAACAPLAFSLQGAAQWSNQCSSERQSACVLRIRSGKLVCPLLRMTSTPTVGLLLQKPAYPPVGLYSAAYKLAAGDTSLMPTSRSCLADATKLLPSTCSCEDVHALHRSLCLLQQEHRVLSRRVLRLESITTDLVQTLQTADDIALLERRTSSAVVYNEQLTSKRPLRLLRAELKTLQGKYSL